MLVIVCVFFFCLSNNKIGHEKYLNVPTIEVANHIILKALLNFNTTILVELENTTVIIKFKYDNIMIMNIGSIIFTVM